MKNVFVSGITTKDGTGTKLAVLVADQRDVVLRIDEQKEIRLTPHDAHGLIGILLQGLDFIHGSTP